MSAATNGWGLIGTGQIAEDRILPGINAHPGNKLIGVVSRSKERAESFAKRFRAKHAYTSYEELLRNPEVSVVAIHTPNAMHAEQAVLAARAGKHVFCDKPMAINAKDAERVVQECAKAGVKLGVNFHCRYMPCFIEAKRLVESGSLGEILLVTLEASAGARPGGTLASWRVDPVVAGLGTSMTVGVHVYDILRFILSSEIVQVSALFDRPRCVMEQTSMATFQFANGVLAQVNVNEKTPNPHNDFVIYGAKGRITGRALTRSRAPGTMETLIDGKVTRTDYPSVNAHALCIAAFSQALLDGREPTPSGLDGYRSVQLTDAMAKSAWDGVHVRIPV